MHADGRDDDVAFGVNHADVARTRIHHVSLILPAVRRNPGRFTSDSDGFRWLKRAQVDDADRIALAVGDVGVLVVSRTIIVELPFVEIQPPNGRNNGRQDNDEENFSQELLAIPRRSKVTRACKGSVLLIELKAHHHFYLDCGWLPVLGCGVKLPCAHCSNRVCIQSGVKGFDNFHVLRLALLGDR